MSGGTNNNFLQDVERFLRERGISATQFGALSVGDTKFVRSLRHGRRCRPETESRIRAWMAAERGRSC